MKKQNNISTINQNNIVFKATNESYNNPNLWLVD